MSHKPNTLMLVDVRAGDIAELFELPFSTAAFGDFAPGSAMVASNPRDRAFLTVEFASKSAATRAAFASIDGALAALEPQLEIDAHAVTGGKPLRVKLRFRKMADFSPEEVSRLVIEHARAEGLPSPDLQQVDEILGAPAFERLAASWRGLEYLESWLGKKWSCTLHLFPLTKVELWQDLSHCDGVEDSVLFQKIYGGVSRSPYKQDWRYFYDFPVGDSLEKHAVAPFAETNS